MQPIPTTERERQAARLAEQVGNPAEFMARYRRIRAGGLYAASQSSPTERRRVPLAITHAQTPIIIPEIFIDFFSPLHLRATIRDIQRAFCRVFPTVHPSQLSSAQRTAPLVHIRQTCMALCKRLTLKSLPEIGRSFGGRDHTTVLHAVKKYAAMLDEIGLPESASLDEWALAIRSRILPNAIK